jgi:hypothetical protein
MEKTQFSNYKIGSLYMIHKHNQIGFRSESKWAFQTLKKYINVFAKQGEYNEAPRALILSWKWVELARS